MWLGRKKIGEKQKKTRANSREKRAHTHTLTRVKEREQERMTRKRRRRKLNNHGWISFGTLYLLFRENSRISWNEIIRKNRSLWFVRCIYHFHWNALSRFSSRVFFHFSGYFLNGFIDAGNMMENFNFLFDETLCFIFNKALSSPLSFSSHPVGWMPGN